MCLCIIESLPRNGKWGPDARTGRSSPSKLQFFFFEREMVQYGSQGTSLMVMPVMVTARSIRVLVPRAAWPVTPVCMERADWGAGGGIQPKSKQD